MMDKKVAFVNAIIIINIHEMETVHGNNRPAGRSIIPIIENKNKIIQILKYFGFVYGVVIIEIIVLLIIQVKTLSLELHCNTVLLFILDLFYDEGGERVGREGGVEVAAGYSDGEWPGFVLKVTCNNDVGVFGSAVDDGRSIAAVCAW